VFFNLAKDVSLVSELHDHTETVGLILEKGILVADDTRVAEMVSWVWLLT
jgi:hypothetical protein